jgi:hypothetical protein
LLRRCDGIGRDLGEEERDEMIYLTSNISGATRRAAYAQNSALGLLLSPLGWRRPWCDFWACDNDVFAGRWNEAGWLKMLDKAAKHHPPLFCILPDVVGDWATTLDRAYQYRQEVESRGLRVALALQDGCNWKEVKDFAPFAVFVGGSTRWKWENTPRVIAMFQNKSWVHVGRVNGENRIRYVRKLGADSADGTGLCRFFDAVLPKVLRGLNHESPQQELF